VAQKATELGVRWLQPIRTERTIVTRINRERLHANVVEAAEQTGRNDLPILQDIKDLPTALAALAPETRVLFCDETQQATFLPRALRGQSVTVPWVIVVGPEGGFTPREAALLRQIPNVVSCHLGTNIVRADTAAMMAISGWQYWYGESTNA
jgi:16S rRNA (uracil1498-N3)-methyltransferase